MKPLNHILASSVAGGLFYLFSKSIVAGFVCFLSGVLIDLDHFFDFCFYSKKITLSLRKFYVSCMELKFNKLYLFFHSLELIILFWFLIIIFKLNLIWVALAVGITCHMFLDIIGNDHLFVRSYFFIYRLSKGFKTEAFLKDAI